ncbi:exported hypothetical protein [Nitrosotalea sinensis]|uniref:Uncharacterized protein n=1 Tax=Nitrosotalea sinensis TaxID=1499975 RepID=A0A2H1EH08_9ARCH|nr:exported hypothetical protein [Candidatus Nitrosotalea sinensis]
MSATVMLGIAATLVWSFNLLSTESVFAQVSDPSTDPNAGPIPEGNYTDNSTGPISEDNTTSTGPDTGDMSTQDNTDLSSNPDSALAPSDNPLANDTNDTSNNMTQTVIPTPQNTTTVSHPTAATIMPPLEQVKAGTSPKDVQCKQGFSLIIKLDDGSPACVKPDVLQILTQRGW